MRAVRLARRGWAGLACVLALGIAALAASMGRDPWPVRAAIRPGPHERAGFTRDGRGVVTTDRVASTAWDLATGRPRPGGEVGLRQVTPAAGGRSAVGVAGDDRSRSDVVRVDLGSGKVLARFPLNRARALGPTLTADGRSIRAAVLAQDRAIPEVITWDLATGTESRRPVFGPRGPEPLVPRVGDQVVGRFPRAVAPDGRTWAFAQINPAGVRLWDAEADRPIGDLIATPFGVGTATFTPDGRALIVGDGLGGFAIFDLAGPGPTRTVRFDPGDLLLGAVAVSPDGRTLAAGGMRPNNLPASAPARFLRDLRSLIPGWNQRRETRVTLIDLATGQILAESPGSIDPEFAPDGSALLTREPDGSIAVRDVPRPPGR